MKAPVVIRHILAAALLVIRHSSFVILLSFLAACANEGQLYVKKHPELKAEHQKIMATGKIPDGTAVAGLTREQIRIAMGVDPYTIDREGNEDVWVFSHKKAISKDELESPKSPAESQVLDRTHGYGESNTDENAPRLDVDVKTSVYFDGNIATHARTVQEPAR